MFEPPENMPERSENTSELLETGSKVIKEVHEAPKEIPNATKAMHEAAEGNSDVIEKACEVAKEAPDTTEKLPAVHRDSSDGMKEGLEISENTSEAPADVSQTGKNIPKIDEEKFITAKSASTTTKNLPGIFRARKLRTRKRRTKKFFISIGLLCLLLCLLGSGTIFELLQYQQEYHKDLTLAQAGIQHLRKAEALLAPLSKDPLNSPAITQAQQEFSMALSSFQQVSTDLKTLPGISTSVPVYGSKLTAALHVLPLAIEVSQTGILACQTLNLLIPPLHNPMGTTGLRLTQADLTTTSQNVQHIQAMLNLMGNQVDHLQPNDLQLDPSLGKFIGIFRKDIPHLQDILNQVQGVLAIAPVVLGVNTPANYLIEVMDSTELRPGGGFIGNYGIMTLTGGHITNMSITDIDLIDKPFEMAGHTISYPPAYTWFDLAPQSWSLRDSNLDADFPTDARYGEQLYAQEGGNVPLQGVIAITPWFMQGILNITGPIDMRPEYNETVTAQNVIDRIHFHQLGKGVEGSELIPSPDGHSSLRKRFTSYLAEHVLARVHQLSVSSALFSHFSTLLLNSLRAKDLQIYFNSNGAEKLLQQYQYSATIQAAPGDSFFVVDANVAADKANEFITYTSHDQVTIDPAGNARHHTTLSYAWNIPGQDYGSSLYRDYVHIYVPPGSSLQAQNGWQSRGTGQVFGREVWMGFFTLTAGQTQVITLDWVIPAAAQKDASGVWHYHDLIQKQAGDTWIFDLQVALPACAVIDKTSGGLVTRAKQLATFSGSLSEDKSFGVDYICQ